MGVGSRFSREECLRYAEHLQRTGQGVSYPGAYAKVICRTGEDDSQIESFLNPPPQVDLTKCLDCNGTGFKQVERDGREGVVKCSHEQLKQQESNG